MVLVWYPKCSTCQRAKAWLDEHGVAYTLSDIKEENPNAEELRASGAFSTQAGCCTKAWR